MTHRLEKKPTEQQRRLQAMRIPSDPVAADQSCHQADIAMSLSPALFPRSVTRWCTGGAGDERVHLQAHFKICPCIWDTRSNCEVSRCSCDAMQLPAPPDHRMLRRSGTGRDATDLGFVRLCGRRRRRPWGLYSVMSSPRFLIF